MPSFEEMLEFSQESFLETYGNSNRMRQFSNGHHTVPAIMESRSSKSKLNKYQTINFGTPSEDDLKNNNSTAKTKRDDKAGRSIGRLKKNPAERSEQSPKMSQESTSVGQRFRKISVDKLSSLGGAMQAAMYRRRKSVATELPGRNNFEKKVERKQSLVSLNASPNLLIKTRSIGSGSTDDDESYHDSARVSSSSSTSNCSSVPNSPPSNVAHQGYLEYRNKKKKWERFWCSLQEGGIYCYLTPQHEKPRDIILLRGYEIIADVKKTNRVRFIFHLQQQGFPNMYFSSETYRDYLLWVGCLEREVLTLNSILSSSRSSTLKSEDSYFQTEHERRLSMFRKHRSSLPNIHEPSGKQKEVLNQLAKVPNEKNQLSPVILQKQKLLNELALQKKHLLEEQEILNQLPASPRIYGEDSKRSLDPSDQDFKDYLDKKVEYESRTRELKKFLDHRRKSCQSLKVPQTSAGFSPFRTPKRLDNEVDLVRIETKLKALQEILDQISLELKEKKENQLPILDTERRKREVEFLIKQQQDAIEQIVKNHSENDSRLQRRRSCDASMMSYLKHQRKNFPPTTSRAPAMEKADTSSPNDSPISSNKLACSPDILINERFYLENVEDGEDVTTDEDSGFQASNERLGGDTDHLYPNTKLITESNPAENEASSNKTSSPHQTPPLQNDPLPFQSSSQEIDSSILAKIEDFEIFAKQKLEEKRKQT